MIHRLIDLSLDHRLLVSILWLALVLAGVRAAFELPIDAVPDITNLQVQVLTDSPGLAPEEVEQFVTFPVETAMSGLPRLQEIRSLSKFGLSVVTVVFEEGTDIYWARQQVAERLAEARGDIPEGYGDPVLAPITTGLGEVYHFEVRGEPLCDSGAPDRSEKDACWSAMELRALLDWVVTPQLRTVPGVVEVNAFGGEVRTYQATLDPERLAAYRLGVPDVVEAIRANHLNVGGGTLAYQGEQYVVRGEGRIDTLDDLGTTVVTESGGAPVYLSDLGTMELAPLLRQGAVTRDGEREAVVGIALMLLGENSRTVARAVDRRVGEIAPSLPEGVAIDTFYDRSELVDRTIRTVAGNLLEGSLLVIVVLLLLIGSVRAGLLVALVIPVSMAVAALLMHAVGISGNLMSLGALDFGLIVDGAVVMVDAIVRAFGRRQDTDGEDLSHLSAVETVRRAAHGVARPVVFGVGIVVLVYLPILALRGIEGKMFRPMALTVVFALATALVAALTLVPILGSVFLTKTRVSDPPVYRFLRRLYEPALDLVLTRRVWVYGLVAVLVAASFCLMPFLGAEFLPNLDEGAIALHIQRLPSISLETSNEVSLLAEQTLLDHFPDEVETIVSRTGRPEVALDPMGVELGDTFVMLHPRDQWSDRFDSKEELVEAMEVALEREVPGAAYAFTQPIELRFAELIGGVRSDVAIHLYGPDLDLLRQKAEEIAAVVGAVPGARDVRAEQIQGLPMLRVEVDRQAIARYGLTAEEVLTAVQAMAGLQVGTVIDGAMRFPLQVRLAEEVRLDPTRIADVRIPVSDRADGETAMIPLGQLARVWVDEGPAQINRESVSRRIAVEANVRGRDLASFVAEAKEAVAEQVELPGGWVLRWGGQFENLEAASERFALIVPLVLLLIFALLYTAFGSGSLAALVFLNVPVALSGGLFALWIRGYPFSISAAVGFIALFGIAVLNGVVLLDRLRALEREEPELSLREVARLGARSRLRAVLMTASTDIIGFIPMMLAVSAGAEVQRPLATVVVGGLVTATLLTLFVLPALYPRFAPRTAAAG